ncbi:MAG: DUF4118 domain-containing protein [Saprospiraceae bacterium]|nr:DUF4118 domain-containing protein [Saprospiraceae bacterium]
MNLSILSIFTKKILTFLPTRQLPHPIQFAVSLILVLAVALLYYYADSLIDYRIVALVLLMTVSIIAMLFDMMPVLSAAVLSAVIWNFFFIPPIFTFHISNAEDLLFFLLYFLIACVNAVLTLKIRDAEKKARDKEEKENTIKLYNTLLNSLSHELRTPISTIIGAVDTLQENKAQLSIPHQNELLSQIELAGLRLNRQVENLLSMSRLESGMLKLKLDWCDLNELIHSVIDKFVTIPTHKILFSANDKLPLFKLDAYLLEQVLYNLIQNAVLYTPQNTIIKLSAEFISNECVIRISDNGKGFPEHEIPLVFQKFYRLPKSRTGGSGLGLSIVKGFVEAHRGCVKLENNSQGGATFTLYIPAEASYINILKNE